MRTMRAGDGDEQKGRYLGALSPPLPATAHATGRGARDQYYILIRTTWYIYVMLWAKKS